MKNIEKYQGIFPAFYACYKADGTINTDAVEKYTRFLIGKGIKGLYVGGSSGECIYQNLEERKRILEHVMKASAGKITVIAHVACNNTADSCKLARHAQKLGVDAIAAIPPIYFHLPDYAIADYWNSISAAAPKTDFIIYNIPQLAGVALTTNLLKEMLKNPKVIGVKNSSMPVQDIQLFKAEGGKDFVVFNGPDEQLISGLAMGADGGIGGTYGVMPELYVQLFELVKENKMKKALAIQNAADEIIYKMCSARGNLYSVQKAIVRQRNGIDLGDVRPPLPACCPQDDVIIREAASMIDTAIQKYC